MSKDCGIDSLLKGVIETWESRIAEGEKIFPEKGREDFSKWRVDDIFLKVEKWGEGLGLGRGDCWTEGRGGGVILTTVCWTR